MNDLDRPKVVLVNRCVIQNDSEQLLLVKRSRGDTFNSGLWEFPGGKLEAGQDLATALEREIFEETGLSIEPVSTLVHVDSFVITEGKYSGLPYVVLVGLGRVAGGSLQLSSEHEDAAWESYEDALTYSLTNESEKALRVLGSSALLHRRYL